MVYSVISVVWAYILNCELSGMVNIYVLGCQNVNACGLLKRNGLSQLNRKCELRTGGPKTAVKKKQPGPKILVWAQPKQLRLGRINKI